jgi:uncharacterized membrane protein
LRSALPFAWQRLLLVLLVALAAAVRCATLSFQSLWLDEVHTVVEASRPWGTLLLGLVTPQQGYPLYILAMRLWIAICGTSEVALRLPSALAGVAAVPLLYLLGRKVWGWQVGLLAAAFLALSPLAIWYSQEAKAYAFFILVTVVAWLLLWEAVQRHDRRIWWALAGVTILALSIHRLYILSVIGQLVYIVYIARQGHLTRRYRLLLLGLLAAVLLITLAGLWFVLGGEGAGSQFGTQRDWKDLASTFTQFSLRIVPGPPDPPIGPDRRPWLLPFAAAALAGLAALFTDIVARGARRRHAVFLLCFLAVPLGAFYLLYLIRPFYYERYLLGTLPAYLLLLAVGVTRLWRWAQALAARVTKHSSRFASPTTRPRPLLSGIPSLLLGLLALATGLGILAPSWQQVQDWTFSRLPLKEQYREATRYLQEHLHPGDLVVVHPGYILPAVELYGERFPRVPLELYTITNTMTLNYGYKEFTDTMDRLARGRRRACLLYAPYHAQTQEYSYRVYDWFWLNPFLHCDEQHWTGLDLYCVSFNTRYRGYMPRPAVALDARFGQEILLWGADVEPFQEPLWPGDTLPVTLYLQGQQPGLPDLTAYVRLVSAGGQQVWAEEERQPLGGHVPTSLWRPGVPFMDYHELLLPADIPPGQYVVMVGFYRAGPYGMLLLPDGSTWADLGTVEVAPGGAP